jgi:hypothetical protein
VTADSGRGGPGGWPQASPGRIAATSITAKEADMPERAQDALRKAIELELARERSITEVASTIKGRLGDIKLPGGGINQYFSKGWWFSKSNDPKPFSKTPLFSKQPDAEDLFERPDLDPMIRELVEMDQADFVEFTDRLLRLKNIKGNAGPTG